MRCERARFSPVRDAPPRNCSSCCLCLAVTIALIWWTDERAPARPDADEPFVREYLYGLADGALGQAGLLDEPGQGWQRPARWDLSSLDLAAQDVSELQVGRLVGLMINTPHGVTLAGQAIRWLALSCCDMPWHDSSYGLGKQSNCGPWGDWRWLGRWRRGGAWT